MLTVGFSSTIMSRVAEEIDAPFFTTTLKHITSIAVPLVALVVLMCGYPKKPKLSLPSTCRSEVNPPYKEAIYSVLLRPLRRKSQRVSERDNRDDSEKVHSF